MRVFGAKFSSLAVVVRVFYENFVFLPKESTFKQNMFYRKIMCLFLFGIQYKTFFFWCLTDFLFFLETTVLLFLFIHFVLLLVVVKILFLFVSLFWEINKVFLLLLCCGKCHNYIQLTQRNKLLLFPSTFFIHNIFWKKS